MANFIARLLQTQPEPEPNLSKLPENCIVAILSFTTPRDVCILSVVCKVFRSAANSNTLWNKFLPLQCQQIVPRADTPIVFSSKRELYFRLCDPILIDGGRKRFWLERSTAKICYMLCARELSIIWGNDQRYWRWVSRDDSSFEELAELLTVWWLEVQGRFDCRALSAGTEYRASFVLKFGQQPSGWDERPVKFSITTPEVKSMESQHILLERINILGWTEVDAGVFKVRAEEYNDVDSSSIEFRMREVDGKHGKRGLLIDGVRIEPNSS